MHVHGTRTRKREISMPLDHACHLPAAAIDATWIKSNRSNPNGECVEMARLPGGKVAVRNSRYPDGPALIFPLQTIAALVRAIRDDGWEDLAGLSANGAKALVAGAGRTARRGGILCRGF